MSEGGFSLLLKGCDRCCSKWFGIRFSLDSSSHGRADTGLNHVVRVSNHRQNKHLLICSVILGQEGGAESSSEQDSEFSDMDEDDAVQMADFEETHALGGPLTEGTRARKATVDPAAEENANTGTVGRRARRGSGNASPTVVSTSNAASQRQNSRHSCNEHAL